MVQIDTLHDLDVGESTGLTDDAKDPHLGDAGSRQIEANHDRDGVRSHHFFWTKIRKAEYLVQVGDMLVPSVHRSRPFVHVLICVLEEAIDVHLGGQYIEFEANIIMSQLGEVARSESFANMKTGIW